MKFCLVTVPFVLLAGQALAQSQQPLARLPPGCLLHAVNTQDEPGDLNTVCGDNAQEVQDAIASICSDNVASQAQAAFIATCSGAGKTVAAYTPTASSPGSKTTGNVLTTTDPEGRVVTQQTSPATTSNAAVPVLAAQQITGGYIAMIGAIFAVAAM